MPVHALAPSPPTPEHAPPRMVALLGAESTGKTLLTQALAAHWRAQGLRVMVVPEVLRAWCDQAGRTPRADEQLAIAQEQARRAELAHRSAVDWVLVDTTPLMTAVYSDLLFGDDSLYPFALRHHQLYSDTLVTGLDLPWVADGQRDGPHARTPVDRLLRQALAKAAVEYRVIYGQGAARRVHALRALAASDAGAPSASPDDAAPAPWVWACDTCSDPQCEHRLLAQQRLRQR